MGLVSCCADKKYAYERNEAESDIEVHETEKMTFDEAFILVEKLKSSALESSPGILEYVYKIEKEINAERSQKIVQRTITDFFASTSKN